jgi:hypothetical protein
MMHGPCGALNRNYPCTKNHQTCKNNYPRTFNGNSIRGKDSYPVYRRCNDSWTKIVWKCTHKCWDCSSIQAVKYLFKYIYMGHDRASIFVTDKANEAQIDEIRQYRDARWVTPLEALWRIYDFKLSKIHPSVLQLQLHLPNMHMVSYNSQENINDGNRWPLKIIEQERDRTSYCHKPIV